MSWTPEQLATVKRMVAEEKSAGDIGKVIGKSRNAVIGKILRMGGKLGRLTPKASGPKSTKTMEPRWVPGGRGRPPASVKPRGKSAVGSRQSAVEGEWDRAPALVLKGSGTAPLSALPGISPTRGEITRPAVVLDRRATTVDRPIVAPVPSHQALALIPMTFLDAVNRNRCLYFADEPMAPAGPDMPVCGAHRAEHPKLTRYCPRHQRSQAAA